MPRRFFALPSLVASPRVHPSSSQPSPSTPSSPPSAPPPSPTTITLQWNRLLLGIFSMSLLWASSLTTAVFFTEYFVLMPPVTFPIKVCQTAVRSIREQATAYSQCAKRQLATCDIDLDDAAAKERARSQWAQEQNTQRLDRAQALYSECGGALTAAQAALGAWSKLLGPMEELPYVVAAAATNISATDTNTSSSTQAQTCSADERTRTQALLGDSSGSKTQVMASSAQYSKESKGTVTRLADYSVALNDYNAVYIANKTQSLRLAALEMVTQINGLEVGTMNASFDDLRVHVASLVGCISPAASLGGEQQQSISTCTALARSARQRLEDMVQDWQALFRDAAEGFQEYKDNWYAVAQRSQAAFDRFVKFYNDIANGIKKAGMSIHDPMFGNTFDIDFATMFVNPGQLLDGVGILTDVPPVPSLDSIWLGVQPALELYLRNVTLASVATNLRALEWAMSLETAFGGWDVAPEDYRPPEYRGSDGEVVGIEAAAAAHNAMADSFVAKTATSLETFDSYADYVGSSVNSTLSNASKLNVSSVMGSLPRFDFSFNLKYESLAAPDFDMDRFLRIFDDLPSMAMCTDTAYRVYSSVRILWKFHSSQRAVTLPTVDLRDESWVASGGRQAMECWVAFQMLQPRRLLAQVLASKYLPYMLMGGVLFPVFVYALALYLAAYHDYQQGCVFGGFERPLPQEQQQQEQQQQGPQQAPTRTYSFATKTINSLSFNAAAYGGNQGMYDGLKTYNQRRAQICADYGKAAQTTQLNAARYLASLQSSQEETQAKVRLLGSCLNVTALDLSFEKACCAGYSNVTAAGVVEPFTYPVCNGDDLGGGGNMTAPTCPINANYDPPRPYPPLSLTLRTPACRAENEPSTTTTNITTTTTPTSTTWTLEDGVFHCEVLPSCVPTCSGPHPELLQTWSRHCACSSEWALHAYVMAGSLAVLTYLILNLFRKLLLRGLAQMYWQQLSEGTLTVVGQCDLQGQLRFGKGKGKKGKEEKKEKEGEGQGTSVDNPILQAAAAAADAGAATSPRHQEGGGGEEDENEREAQEEEDLRRRHIVQARVEKALRRHEQEGRVLVFVGVALLIGCFVLLTKAPQFLDYHP